MKIQKFCFLYKKISVYTGSIVVSKGGHMFRDSFHQKKFSSTFNMQYLLHAFFFFLTALLISSPAHAPSSPKENDASLEEAFLIRRIAEFWKDQDYEIVKMQISDFLEKHPKSHSKDYLLGLMGDVHLQEGNIRLAFEAYQQIDSEEIKKIILINKLHCLYELNEFASMIQEGEPFLHDLPEDLPSSKREEFLFLMAESYFRSGSESVTNASEKERFFDKARPLYESILETYFEDPAMFSLAEIYYAQKNYRQAAAFFLSLAEKYPEKKDQLSFYAALSQSEFNPSLAIETFSDIAKTNSKYKKEASLNQIILLFHEDKFDEVLDIYENISQNSSSEKEKSLIYILGRSFFAKQNYDKAIEWLNLFLSSLQETSNRNPELRNAIFMQLASAQMTNNYPLYEKTLQIFLTYFPEDQDIPSALFTQATMLKEKNFLQNAEKILARIIQEYPHYEQIETTLLEHGIVSYNNEHWGQSYTSFLTFLNNYPSNPQINLAWKYLLSIGFHLVQNETQNKELNFEKEDLYLLLSKVLSKEKVLSPEEHQECLLLQCQLGYDLKKYHEILPLLQSYINSASNHETIPEAHLLSALCYYKQQEHFDLFCHHATKAFQSESPFMHNASVHLEMYNAYLSVLQQDPPPLNIEHLYELAAEHLFAAIQENHPIKLTNILWLANFYLNKSTRFPELFEIDGRSPPSDSGKELCHRAEKLLCKILLDSTKNSLIPITKEEVFLEQEVLKLANLFGKKSIYKDKIDLLQQLIEQQINNDHWSWNLKEEALLELAKTYEIHGNKNDAWVTLQSLINQYPRPSSFLFEYASFHAHRLSFYFLPNEQKNKSHPTVVKIINFLKGCQIQKNPDSEPLHYEAALEYAQLQTVLAPENEKLICYLFFLNRLKEDYESMEDPTIVNYYKKLEENSEKKKIITLYQKFLNSEIMRCHSLILLEDGKLQEAKIMENKVKDLLTEINKEKHSYYYLKLRENQSLKALGKKKLM